MTTMQAFWTIILLIISNVFMTFAWYGQLKLRQLNIINDWPLVLVILASWGVALLEYSFMVPANKIGSTVTGGPFNLFQLKIIQEVISLTVFTLICVFVFRTDQLQWNHIAAFACMIAAVAFCFMK